MFHKGHSINSDVNLNEIKMFQNEKRVSPPEAMWRIYAFPINLIYPVVILHQLHLQDQHSVYYKESMNLNPSSGYRIFS